MGGKLRIDYHSGSVFISHLDDDGKLVDFYEYDHSKQVTITPSAKAYLSPAEGVLVEDTSPAMKVCCYIGLFVFSVLFFLGMWVAGNMLYDYLTAPPRVASKEIKAKMSYHGIQAVFEDHDGNLYFHRDGQKVRF